MHRTLFLAEANIWIGNSSKRVTRIVEAIDNDHARELFHEYLEMEQYIGEFSPIFASVTYQVYPVIS